MSRGHLRRLSQDRLAPLGAVIELANDMLAALENLPQTPDGWNRFSWDHRNSHDRIRAAIKTKYGADLSDYQVDPIDSNAIGDFLQNNSQLHGDMNGVLGLQSSDLQDVNFGDKPQFEAWVRLHYLEHQQAELKLEI